MKRIKRKEKTAAQQAMIVNFSAANDLRDIARILRINPKDLSYILYKLKQGRENQYTTFEIMKRNGDTRPISAPSTALKEIQKRLNQVLLQVYREKPSVHSFLKERSIVTNAASHAHKRFVFSIDLKNFFPSINFGRVRGLFKAAPYNLNERAATIIAQIACYNNSLPQGAPSSPIISNMICARMDSRLQDLAKQNNCIYTRYADDITFSTNMPNFSREIAFAKDGVVRPGVDLVAVIGSNGFEINEDKVRLQVREMRQEVTGLIVNEFVNIRRKFSSQVRAMLHAWEKYGLAAAEKEHYSRYRRIPRERQETDFKGVVRGKIEFIRMVRGNNKRLELHRKKNGFNKLDLSQRFLYQYFDLILREGVLPAIRTEGVTDWMHLKAAWKVFQKNEKYSDLAFDFCQIRNPIFYGNKVLLGFCEQAKKLKPFGKRIICIFDNDDKDVNKKHKNGPLKEWGNNVYSFPIPHPKRYAGKPISIEFLYPDSFIRTYDTKKRRLFFSDEFNSDGKHKKLNGVTYGINPRTGKEMNGWRDHLSGDRKIIDCCVYKDKAGQFTSIAMSKKDFAANILKGETGFENPNFGEFEKIFDQISVILR